MFIELGYEPKILVFDVKNQNEAESNLLAYSRWEYEKSTKFKFYQNDLISSKLSSIEYDKYSGYLNKYDFVNSILNEYEISANEAFEDFKAHNTKIAHSVYTIYAKKL